MQSTADKPKVARSRTKVKEPPTVQDIVSHTLSNGHSVEASPNPNVTDADDNSCELVDSKRAKPKNEKKKRTPIDHPKKTSDTVHAEKVSINNSSLQGYKSLAAGLSAPQFVTDRAE